MEQGRPEFALRQADAWPSLVGASQVETSPDFVQFSLDELQELKDTSTTDFNTLDFSDYTVDVIDSLFPKPRGQLDPLPSYRTSPKRLREWRRLTTKAQQYLLGTNSSETDSPNSRPTNATPTTTTTTTTTGRASRNGSRKSYVAIVRMQTPTPPLAKSRREDVDDSLRKQQPESKQLSSSPPPAKPRRQDADSSLRMQQHESKQLSSLVAAASTAAQGPGDSSTEVDRIGAIQVEISFPFTKSSQPEVAWKQADSGTGAPLTGGAVSQAETSDDHFVQFSLHELQELQETSTTDFNTLDFSDYTMDVIDALFPKKPKWGDLDPPASYRTSPKRLREWRRLTAKAQRYLVEKVQETAQRQLPADLDPTTTGRAVRARSLRKSHSPMAKKERLKRPMPAQETEDLPSKNKPKKRAKKRLHPSLEASSVASLLLDIRGKK
jgi:hypothetical protein